MKRFLLVLVMIVGMGVLPALADSPEPAPSGPGSPDASSVPVDEPELTPEVVHEEGDWFIGRQASKVDRQQEKYSRRVEAMARGIDSLFGGEESYEGSTGTYFQLSLGFKAEEGEGIEPENKVRLRLDLPNTEDRLQLIIESDDNEDDFGEGLAADSDDEGGVTAGLRYIFTESERWKVNLTGGIKWRVPPDPFATLRIRRDQSLGRWWDMRIEERISWYLSDKFSNRTRLMFDRPLSDRLLFRSQSQQTWEQEEEGIGLKQSLIFFFRSSDRDSLAYRANVDWNTYPGFHLTSYGESVTYRRRIHKQWLFMELVSGVKWPESRDFNTTPWIKLKFEVVFGWKTLDERARAKPLSDEADEVNDDEP